VTVHLPVIEARGTYREIGRCLGEGGREQIRRSLAFHEEKYEWLAGVTFAAAEERAQGLLPYAQRALPQYVEELRGMAEGAGVPLAKLVVLNCGEELMCHCTSVALTTGGRTVLAHNEDWIDDDIENMVVFDVTCPDGTRFLSLSGAAYLAGCGINSHGLALGGNSVYATDERPGVPNSFVLRWKLEARTRDEVDARSTLAGRARGSNHLTARVGGQVWDVETSSTKHAAIDADGGWLAHTNHYLSASLADVEGSTSAGTRLRLARARAIVTQGLADGDDGFAIAARVLRDHENPPTSICCHTVPGEVDPAPTTGGFICEVEERRMHVCAGPPCENPFITLELR